MTRLEESLVFPCEGIFWVVNNKVISFTDEVTPQDSMFMTNLLHKNVWEEIKEQYKVNNTIVSYDYFPRGRVETLALNIGGKQQCHSDVYMDKCVFYNRKVREQIENDFRLYLPNVKVQYEGQLFIDGSHYTCYKCK